jgi:hypothetical protein
MTTAVDVAAAAFRATLTERGTLVDLADEEARDLGHRAALLVGSTASWHEHLGELLDVPAVMALLGVGTRQAVYDLVTRRRMLALPRRGGSMVFPAFQFDPATGRPYPQIPQILTIFGAAGLDSYTVATWLSTAQDQLNGATPTSLLATADSAETVLDAARRTATRLSR